MSGNEGNSGRVENGFRLGRKMTDDDGEAL